MGEMAKFLSSWYKVRQNMSATAQDMPEEHYDWALFDGIWTFLHHLCPFLPLPLPPGLRRLAMQPTAMASFDRSPSDNYKIQENRCWRQA